MMQITRSMSSAVYIYRGQYNNATDFREEVFYNPGDAIDFAMENIRECYEFRVINTTDYSTVYSTRMAEAENALNILVLRDESGED